MIAVSQYKVAQLTPDDRPSLDQVQHLLDEHAQEGWELVTALQFEGAVGQQVDQMIRSFSNTASTVFTVSGFRESRTVISVTSTSVEHSVEQYRLFGQREREFHSLQ